MTGDSFSGKYDVVAEPRAQRLQCFRLSLPEVHLTSSILTCVATRGCTYRQSSSQGSVSITRDSEFISLALIPILVTTSNFEQGVTGVRLSEPTA